MALNPITDGWTIDGKFPGQGWQSPFSYRYRPALSARVVQYRADTREVSPKVVTQKQIEFLREFIVSWDRVDKDGNPMSLTDDMAFQSLSDAAMSYLWSDLAGYGADSWQSQGKNFSSPSA